nr:helicase-associated domain-containing protein [Paenibacillus sp. GSMTC-2017]
MQSSVGWTERWLSLFHELGWIELAQCVENGESYRVFCWKVFQSHNSEELIVQPNGEIIIGPGSRFDIRFELELICERMNGEEAVLYQLTPQSVATAIEHSRTRDSIASFLKAASGDEQLPSSVLSMLEEWTRRAGRFTFAEVTLLRCDSVEMAETATLLQEVAPHLIQRLGEFDYIIEASKRDHIRRYLQKAGYPPRKGIQRADERIAAHAIDVTDQHVVIQSDKIITAGKREMGTFLYDSFTLSHYELDNITRREEVILLPGIEQLPAAWWQQLRSYHTSTRKELIQQAVMLQTAVQLKLAGNLHTFVPEQMEKRGDEWAVTGKLISNDVGEFSRLTPDMWEEMRLLIPGSHTM